MKNTIRKKWIITTVVFTAVLLLITAVFLLPGTKQPAEDTAAEQIVAVNEVQQLIRRGEDEQAALKLQALKEKMQAGQINEAAPSKKGMPVLTGQRLFHKKSKKKERTGRQSISCLFS